MAPLFDPAKLARLLACYPVIMGDVSEEEALDCLISCSSSCYRSLLSGPRLLNKLTPSRWENVRPSAVYDLTNIHLLNTNSPRRRIKRHSSNQYALARGAVSLPSLRTKVAPSHKEFSESYMSGYLDENFTYVYPGGLSKKSGATEEHKLHKESPTHHCNTEPMQKQRSQSISTHTLTLDSVFAGRLHAAQMDSRTRNEISKIVAMQLRSDVLAEQLFVENRLRNLDLNTFPLLGMGNSGGCGVNSLESARGKSLSISAPPLINSVSHIQAQRQQSHKKREKRRRKQQESKAPLDWCPISIPEPQYIGDIPFDSPQHRTAGASMHNHHVRFGSLRGSGSKGLSLSGVGSGTAPKQSASIQTQKGTERSKKRRSVTYFGQEEFALESSIPKSAEHSEHSIPVVVPMLDQEYVTRSKYRLPSKFSPNSSFANAIS